MRILLVQSRPPARRGFRSGFRTMAVTEPLGLEMVAGALAREHEVQLVDALPGTDVEKLAGDFHPDACGVSCSFTVGVRETVRLTQLLKSLPSRPFVFVGGHHASLNPQDFLQPSIDAVVSGEGEESTVEMIRSLETSGDLRKVRGLVVNQGEVQMSTPPRPLVSDLDCLPFPAREMTDRWRSRYYLGLRAPIASLETARGCPYRCTFCSVWRFYRGRCRYKSVERVLEEIESIQEANVFVTDDNFFSDVKRASRIATGLLDRQIRKSYVVQARSDTIAHHPELIALWREAGLRSVFVGLEKIDARGLEKLHKRNTVENNEKALQVLHRHRIGVMATIIVDPDYETGDFAALRSYVRNHRLDMLSFTILTPLPGTPLFEELNDSLITRNCEMFDLLHAVVPTRLQLRTFYREVASLYTSAYLIRTWPRRVARRLCVRLDSVPKLRPLLKSLPSLWYLSRPEEYLVGHEEGVPSG